MLRARAVCAAALALTATALLPGASAVGRPRAQVTSDQTGVARAVAFLARDVPRWRADEGCYSCHNNGDGARALMLARAAGYDVGTSLADTVRFLGAPDTWESGPAGPMEDKVLARVQFTLALSQAVDAKLAPEASLATAARQLAADQREDGSWRLDASGSLGSPATYGTALATWAARRSLVRSGLADLTPSVRRADTWLGAEQPRTTVDAAAIVLGTTGTASSARSRDRRVEELLSWQSARGGWGPYPNVRTEPFDTAVAVLALLGTAGTPDTASAIARGRAYLSDTMLPDGSWPETTRPAGQPSYAQRISTTAWAAMALIARDGAGGLLDLEPARRSGRRGVIVDLVEAIHLEEPSHTIAGRVLENRQHDEVVRAGRPRGGGRELP